MNEAQLQRTVLELSTLYGWRSIHLAPAQVRGRWMTAMVGQGAGWPDYFGIRDTRAVVAELKGYNAKGHLGQLEAEQWEWLYTLQQVPGIEAYLWTPDDVDGIAEILR